MMLGMYKAMPDLRLTIEIISRNLLTSGTRE